MDIPIEKNWKLVMADQKYETYNDWYAIYMAKNLFRFSSPQVSSFGSYSSDSVMICLDPQDYCQKNEYDGDKPDRNHYTSDLGVFFRKPASKRVCDH